jgi:hypothetical protein
MMNERKKADSEGSNDQSQPQSQQQDYDLPQLPNVLTHPGNVLLFTSVPLLAGAFVGYKLPTLQSLQEMVGDRSATAAGGTPSRHSLQPTGAAPLTADEVRALASRTAVRAFRIATFGTVATFGAFGALAFHLSGYQSMEEAVQGTRRWATSCREALERFFGTAERRDKLLSQHPDVVATKHMTEEQEMNYLYNKYMASSSPNEDEAEDASSGDKKNGKGSQ